MICYKYFTFIFFMVTFYLPNSVEPFLTINYVHVKLKYLKKQNQAHVKLNMVWTNLVRKFNCALNLHSPLQKNAPSASETISQINTW